MRHVTPPLEVCNKETSFYSNRERQQRRTSFFSDSVSSAVTKVSDENATNDEHKTVQLKSASFKDFHPTLRLTEKPQSKRRRKQKSQILTATPDAGIFGRKER